MDTHDLEIAIRRNPQMGCYVVVLLNNGAVQSVESYSWLTQYVSEASALRSARSGARDLAKRWPSASICDETRGAFVRWVRALFRGKR